MTIAHAEQLKSQLTDQYVVVQDGVPELRRFSGLTGRVKTVNMSGRALVQFDSDVDIGWYDIDPDYLTVISEPLPKAAPPKAHTAAAKPAPAAKAPAASGGSPLDQIRAQAAAAPEAPAAGSKPSALDLIRQQAAAKKS